MEFTATLAPKAVNTPIVPKASARQVGIEKRAVPRQTRQRPLLCQDTQMQLPPNRFKSRLQTGETMFGCWVALCAPYSAEVAGHAGFDWVLIDGEHAPNDLQSLVAQLQVLDPLPPEVLVRLPMAEPWLIKQVLDAGARNLLIPMVNSAAEANANVRAMRYPPRGIRGVGHALGRASRFGEIADYQNAADDGLSLLVQIETAAALLALDDILAVDGVDGAFIGPADLAADLGLAGDDPAFAQTIATTLGRIRDSGKAPGIISLSDDQIARHLQDGAQVVAVAIDVLTLSQGLRARSARWVALG